MADQTGIEWTDATWNPVTGCSKASPGCKHCYALRDWPRMSANRQTIYFGREFTDVQGHHERLDQPIRWTKPRKIFVNSMSDLFHEDVPEEFIDSVFAVMAIANQHTFQVLTKRADRMQNYMWRLQSRGAEIARAAMHVLNGKYWSDPDDISDLVAQRISNGPLVNVWLGVSVENQEYANKRIPHLLSTPAAVRWLSVEPMLGPVSLKSFLGDGTSAIAWLVCGGESGPRARPMHPAWARALRDECAASRVPMLFKQWGEWLPWLDFQQVGIDDDLEQTRYQTVIWQDDQWVDCGRPLWCDMEDNYGGGAASPSEPDQVMGRVGKRNAGRMLDGVLHDEYPVTPHLLEPA